MKRRLNILAHIKDQVSGMKNEKLELTKAVLRIIKEKENTTGL